MIAVAVDSSGEIGKAVGNSFRENAMSDDTAAAISATRKDWAAEHRERYLRSGGREGHIEDLTAVGAHQLGTNLLLKYVGRKSGKTFITGLCYGIVGGEVVIIASKGGADHHPDWYLNLREMDEVHFQIASQAFRATWREAEGADRERAWAHMICNFPFYANYQASTDRVIPVILLQRHEEVPVFQESDATGIRR